MQVEYANKWSNITFLNHFFLSFASTNFTQGDY